ncbi:MAG TPA: hypothetical protein ENN06_01730 [Desulfobacteraceae bacterium]|nr:hypothetical protein [Desulfobacteraceae bacterium]
MCPSAEQTGNPGPDVFELKDCALIAIATGHRAVNLKELRDILTVISPDSIYYHFWGGLLQPRFEEREYNNDFAAWAWYGMHDATLAERLAVIDPTDFADLEDLRQELLEIMEERLDEQGYLSWLQASSRFEFIRSQIVIFDTGNRVDSPEKLAELLPGLSTGSIFYHFIDARRRLDSGGDDFSFWLSGHGERCSELCRQFAGVDPYFGSLHQIKDQLVKIITNFFA